ncbi:sodium/calcium exchanger family protein/calcium-binding EF hand family protein [Abeliophyllum distichum]|uniref:Sodium/calcium exchanger family protein/calcium-binding EF hand family protein n=1 Tax=Abeliophyllum distichum TaxID=126358 RepID=A0ABD1VPY3_9LAMI
MASRSKPKPVCTLFFFLIFCCFTCDGFISASPDLISDGVHTRAARLPPFLRLYVAEEACEQTYGFLPCTSTALGNLFLIIVYGYLIFLAAKYLSTGSEILLEILGPGVLGVFIPLLEALPDAMLILVSGLSGSSETAQSQVSVGMGLLTGSTVILLTVIWGTCIVVGKCDIQNSVVIDSQDMRGFSLTGSGICTDIWTPYAGFIMTISVIPFIVVQFPQFFHSNSGRHLTVLIALIISVSLLISYCLYQVFQPWVQRRRVAYAKHKHLILRMGFSIEDGKPNVQVFKNLFKAIEENENGSFSRSEVRALIVGMRFREIDLNELDDTVRDIMRFLDANLDSRVDLNEFVAGIIRMLQDYRAYSKHAGPYTRKYLDNYHELTNGEHNHLINQSDAIIVENAPIDHIESCFVIAAGNYYCSCICLSSATRSRKAVSAIIFASRKTLKSASLTLSELYGAVTLNNTLCLSVFLALVYVRELVWDFSSELLVILIVCVVMGIFASIRTTFPLWTSLLAFLLYPFSLALVYVLVYVFGWS